MGPDHQLKKLSQKEGRLQPDGAQGKQPIKVFQMNQPINTLIWATKGKLWSGMTRFQIFPLLMLSFEGTLWVFSTGSSVFNREINNQLHKGPIPCPPCCWLHGCVERTQPCVFLLAHQLLTHLNLWVTFPSFMIQKGNCLSPELFQGLSTVMGLWLKGLTVWI